MEITRYGVKDMPLTLRPAHMRGGCRPGQKRFRTAFPRGVSLRKPEQLAYLFEVASQGNLDIDWWMYNRLTPTFANVVYERSGRLRTEHSDWNGYRCLAQALYDLLEMAGRFEEYLDDEGQTRTTQLSLPLEFGS